VAILPVEMGKDDSSTSQEGRETSVMRAVRREAVGAGYGPAKMSTGYGLPRAVVRKRRERQAGHVQSRR
jgi:hypothetical protein